jgi:hypothetical protein
MICVHSCRSLLVAALAIGLAPLASCGDDAPASKAAATAPSETPVATLSATAPSPEKQAASLVEGASELRAWATRLAKEWGVAPQRRWTATKEADARWRATLTLTGDDPDERITGTWIIRFPLDRGPKPSEIRHIDDPDAFEPVDAGARKLSKAPPVARLQASGAVQVDGYITAGSAGTLILHADQNADNDPASRRGQRLLDGTTKREVEFKPGADTRIVGADGKPMTLTELRATAGGPSSVLVQWSPERPATRLADLESSAPTSITMLGP